MKKVTLLILSFAAVVALTSCGGTKSATNERKEIIIPCADQGKSDAEFFRASSVGKSPDLNTSKDKALQVARERLGAAINSKVKAVTERYANDMDAGGAQEFSQTFETMARTVVSQTLVDINTICEKTYPADGGGYETYVALEVSKDAIYNGIDKGISKDKKLEVMYDRAKFKEKFDEEMAKMDDQ